MPRRSRHSPLPVRGVTLPGPPLGLRRQGSSNLRTQGHQEEQICSQTDDAQLDVGAQEIIVWLTSLSGCIADDPKAKTRSTPSLAGGDDIPQYSMRHARESPGVPRRVLSAPMSVKRSATPGIKGMAATATVTAKSNHRRLRIVTNRPTAKAT